MLCHMHSLYSEKHNLYGDQFLAFVGDKMVRCWPHKDIVFTSEQAYSIIPEAGLYETFQSKTKRQLQRGKYTKSVVQQLCYEHWTPISFFKDMFDLGLYQSSFTPHAMFNILKENYRVVWITKEENAKLDRRHRACRSVGTYSEFGIHIKEKKLWTYLAESVYS